MDPTDRKEFELLAIRKVDDDRRVAHVQVGPISIKSIWIVGLKTGKPRVSWPESGKGYPIVTADEPLKGEIDRMILDRIGGAKAPAPRRAPPRRRSRSSMSTSAGAPFHDDLLDDILPMRVK